MNWNLLESSASLNEALSLSNEQPVLIFKHSTRCSISAMALNRLERSWQQHDQQGLLPFFLDLIRYRGLSQEIAEYTGVTHESPQVLILKNGKCVYDASHYDIRYDDIIRFANHSAAH